MGCKSSVKEIEEEMFMLELKKSRIQEKRVHMMTEFRFETGSQLIRPFIPDYIDHNYMRKIRGLKMFKKFKKGGRIVLEDEINTHRRNEQLTLYNSFFYSFPVHSFSEYLFHLLIQSFLLF